MQVVFSSIRLPARPGSFRDRSLRLLPGVCVTAAIAVFATQLSKGAWLQAHGISALTLAIIGGIVVGNTVYPRICAISAPGVIFSKQILLRAGIILFGLRLTFQDIGQVGAIGVVIDALVLSSTFVLASWAGTRVFGLNRRLAMLIGAGSAICGAAAVMATEPVVRGTCEEVSIAVATVVAFGTLAIFLYPALYQLNEQMHWFSVSPFAYGIFTGSTVHEVAQVVAAGKAVAESTANTAVITKLVRVMMLAPFLVMLAAYLSRHSEEDGAAPVAAAPWTRVIPWFALGFIAVAGCNSLAILPRAVVGTAINIDTLILATAMAALGVSTQFSAIHKAGLKPLGLAALLFGWLIVGGFAINAGVAGLLGHSHGQ